MLADGDREEAFRTCMVMFRLIRHFDRDPRILGLLTSRVCRSLAINTTSHVLQKGPLPELAYLSLEAELALHNLAEPLRRAPRLNAHWAWTPFAIKSLAPGYGQVA